jgi:hypothetical protein
VEKAGLDVGARWAPLVEVALARVGDHGSALADVHHVLVLVAARRAEADLLLETMERVSAERTDHAARLTREVGLDAARAVAWAEQRPAEANRAPPAHRAALAAARRQPRAAQDLHVDRARGCALGSCAARSRRVSEASVADVIARELAGAGCALGRRRRGRGGAAPG